MLLLRQKIDGWEDFVSEEISGVFPYQYSETVLAEWLDVSSIENNNLYGHHAADYVRATDEVNILFQAKTGSTEEEKWSNCTQEEKEAIAERQLVVSSLRLQVFTVSQDQRNFIRYADESMVARSDRIDAAKVGMGYSLSSEDGQDLFSDIADKIPLYITTNNQLLNEYMQSTGPYSGAGFKAKSYWTQGLQDIYSQIVLDGIY